MWITYPHFRATVALIGLLILSACSTLPNDLGRSEVERLVSERGLSMPQQDADQQSILNNQSLTETQAIRYALVNNPELNALYFELGFSAAELYDASRIRNPIFSSALLDSNEPGLGDQLTLSIVASFADVVTLPARKRMANAEFAAAKEEFAFAVLELASTTQASFYDYVAARQTTELRQQAFKAASLSLELAERYYKAGNITPREIALERAAAAEASLVVLRSKADRFKARTHLARLLSVSPSGSWNTISKLPLPPTQEDSIETLLSLALESRLDLSAAKIRADYLADKLGVTNWSRWLGDLTLGFEREREGDGEILKGPTLEWELPIFSFKRGDLLRAETELQSQMAELRAITLDIDHGVRLAFESMNNWEEQVRAYKDQLIPARIDATQRAQREENFMLIGIFELIDSKQEEYDSYEGYIEAVRDYWLARTDLARAVGNKLPSDIAISEERVDVQDFILPEIKGMDHQMHQMKSSKSRHEGHGMKSSMKQDDGIHEGHEMPKREEKEVVQPRKVVEPEANAHKHH